MCALLRKAQIVVIIADVIRMSLNFNLYRRIIKQKVSKKINQALAFISQSGRVGGEIDVVQFTHLSHLNLLHLRIGSHHICFFLLDCNQLSIIGIALLLDGQDQFLSFCRIGDVGGEGVFTRTLIGLVEPRLSQLHQG